ncbi:hypothetical protein M5E89_03290 [Acidaminococcus intestini]|nr:hypothetical protein M5E89_03290 [Acidaminococcus intestini]
MKITAIKLGRISVPLRVPFKTALRRVDSVEDIIVEVHTDTGKLAMEKRLQPVPLRVIRQEPSLAPSPTTSVRPLWGVISMILRT